MSPIDSAASGATRQRVLPLHLSPIETFMLADDRPEYPMTFVIQLHLAGQIQRGAFEAAVAEALQRHPLLQALVQPGKGGLPCWILAPVLQPTIDWAAEEVPMTCPRGERIDLSQEIGLRFWVRQGPQHATVALQFHHAACDGTGAYRFIGDLLAGYGIRTASNGQPPEFGDVDPNLLKNRKHRTLALALGPQPGFKRRALRQAWRIFVRRPTPLATPDSRSRLPKPNTAFPGFHWITLNRTIHQRLRDMAGSSGAMLNDLLLRDLFLTLKQWNRRQGARHPCRPLRIMMPTDLRDTEDCGMPAANLTGYTFVSRPLRDCNAPESLLQSISAETVRIKYQRAGTVFMDAVYAAVNVPRLLPFLLSRNFCLATAVLSNSADPTRRFTGRFPRRAGRLVCGDLLLENLTGVPPLRPNTRATFAIAQYDRCLTISLRCDPHFFRSEDTAALLQLYAEQVQS